jgi:PqqD family protein of HPr-rel-A system
MTSARPRLRDDVVSREVDEELVIYDPVSDRTALLNASAAAVLELCDGHHTCDEIARRVAEIFSVDVEAIEAEIGTALEEFRRQGWLSSR